MPFYKNSNGDYFFSANVPDNPALVEVTEEEVIAAANAVATNQPQVPYSITLRQFKLGLLTIGMLSKLEKELKKDKTFDGSELYINWTYLPTVERDSIFVLDLVSVISMSDDELDRAFIAGASF